ncbi:MAG TPA: hypothetical protein VJO35_08210 [Terriglobales bacterium]|nr:hypothetical protein [Terriglobales bacterium]
MLTFGSKYKKFWDWFQAHEDEIFQFEADQERVFDKLGGRLHRVHRNLTFEFSGIVDGKREFIVSAGGIKTAFPEVAALVREAPTLARWEVIAFRQRKNVPQIRYAGKTVERDSIFFDYIPAGEKLDLTIFVDGMAGASREEITALKTIGYLLLDATVGEYDVETKIAGIEFVDSSMFPDRRRLPFLGLPGVIDKLPGAVQ